MESMVSGETGIRIDSNAEQSPNAENPMCIMLSGISKWRIELHRSKAHAGMFVIVPVKEISSSIEQPEKAPGCNVSPRNSTVRNELGTCQVATCSPWSSNRCVTATHPSFGVAPKIAPKPDHSVPPVSVLEIPVNGIDIALMLEQPENAPGPTIVTESGIEISCNDVQFAKAFVQMLARLPFNEMPESVVHPRKHDPMIRSRFSGQENASKLTQFANAPKPISRTPSGRPIPCNCEHPAKARLCTFVIEDARFTDWSAAQSLNVLDGRNPQSLKTDAERSPEQRSNMPIPSSCTVDGMEALCKAVQSVNAASPMDLTPLPNWMFRNPRQSVAA